MKKKLLSISTFALIAMLVLGVLFAVNYNLIPHLSKGEKFRVPWMGARAFLFEKANPYTTEVTQEIQNAIYGHPVKEGDYPFRLDTPFYLLFFYFPFALIENFDIARAFWMSFSEIALFGVGFLSIHLAEWKTSRLNLVFFFIALFFSFYGLYPILEGSGAIFTALILLSSLLAYREKEEVLLGILLILGLSQLQSGGVLFFFIFFLLLSSKRKKALSVSAMTWIIMMAITLIILPDWFLPFVGAFRANIRIGQGVLFGEALQIWQPDNGVLIANIIKLTSLLILFIEWRGARGRNFKHILWVASFSLVIMPFLGLRISSSLFPFFFLPLVLFFKTAPSRWKNAKWVVPVFSLILLFSWRVFFQNPHALEILSFIFPLILLVALYWMRWWIIRPPRTWADQVMKK